MHSKKMEKKTIVVVGGVGEKWGDTQYRQQHRVIDKGMICYAVCAGSSTALVIRKWRESESSKQQKKDGKENQNRRKNREYSIPKQ